MAAYTKLKGTYLVITMLHPDECAAEASDFLALSSLERDHLRPSDIAEVFQTYFKPTSVEEVKVGGESGAAWIVGSSLNSSRTFPSTLVRRLSRFITSSDFRRSQTEREWLVNGLLGC